MKTVTMDEKRPVFKISTLRFRYVTNIERRFRTHEYKDSPRIFGPLFGCLLIILLGVGKIH